MWTTVCAVDSRGRVVQLNLIRRVVFMFYKLLNRVQYTAASVRIYVNGSG